jgi:hypothetical protein
MQRGCVIFIISASVAILIASLVLRIFFLPEYQSKGSSRIIYVIESAMAEYKEDYGSYPPGGNEIIAKILLGDNSRGKAYLPEDSVVMRDGMMVDLWKRPLRVITNDFKPLVLSAGENGEFDDNDDISSVRARDELQD